MSEIFLTWIDKQSSKNAAGIFDYVIISLKDNIKFKLNKSFFHFLSALPIFDVVHCDMHEVHCAQFLYKNVYRWGSM